MVAGGCWGSRERLYENDGTGVFHDVSHQIPGASSREFELGGPHGGSRRDLLDRINEFLVHNKRAGRRVLLIIDEAQNLPVETLEQVRLLSNLETETEKLIQIVLLGQPELEAMPFS